MQTPPPIRDVKPFLGYAPEDFDAAKAFYRAIGFELLWDQGATVCFETGRQRFLVARHQGIDRTNAGMLHFHVDDVDEWYRYLAGLSLTETFPDVKLAAPAMTDWGLYVAYVWDPGGWLLHFAQPGDQPRD